MQKQQQRQKQKQEQRQKQAQVLRLRPVRLRAPDFAQDDNQNISLRMTIKIYRSG
jgi:hypothetical protein